MKNSRRYKSWLCLMAAIVLSSFFYMAPIMTEDAASQIQTAETARMEQTLADTQGMPEGNVIRGTVVLHGASSRPDSYPDTITAARNVLDEAATKEQHAPRVLIGRFLAVMLMLILFVHMICVILMRRYGCHMIDLWENIYYIHLVDGKKDAPFLECYIRR